MSAQPNSLSNIAVLIDADNASAKNIGHILKEINKLGHITCKKIYGDWGNAHIQSWQEARLTHAIEAKQEFAYVTGKNATDIGMVIEAMDLLYSGNYDGFCLISSDSDFTSLALRIRKNGVKVFGFGKRNTVDAFTKSCDRFFYVEDLLAAQSSFNTAETILHNTVNETNKSNQNLVKAWDNNRLKSDTKLLNSLQTSIVDHSKAEGERWVNFALVGNNFKKQFPSFSPKDYGYTKLANIVKAIDLFETKVVNSTLYVRYKNNKTAVATASSGNESNRRNTNKKLIRWTSKQLQTQTHLISVLNKLIKEDPKSDDGWSNISYLASRIKQHHVNIKLDKYGYEKFSDLMCAIDLYDIKRQSNIVLVALKNNHQKPLNQTDNSPIFSDAPHVKKTWNDTHDAGLCMLSEIYGVALHDGYGD